MKHIALFFAAAVCLIPPAQAEDIEPPGYMPDEEWNGPPLQPDVAGPEVAIEGKIKWVEDKVTPTSRWIEKLAKPFTSWIEGKIHGREKAKADKEKQNPVHRPQVVDQQLQSGQRISSEAAVDLVHQKVQGEVLKVKYVESDLPFYRVKLISKAGEIHIFHVHASTGEIVSVTGQFFPRPPENKSRE